MNKTSIGLATAVENKPGRARAGRCAALALDDIPFQGPFHLSQTLDDLRRRLVQRLFRAHSSEAELGETPSLATPNELVAASLALQKVILPTSGSHRSFNREALN